MRVRSLCLWSARERKSTLEYTPPWNSCKYSMSRCIQFRIFDLFLSLRYHVHSLVMNSMPCILFYYYPPLMMLRLSSACDLYQCTDRVEAARDRAFLVLTYFLPNNRSIVQFNEPFDWHRCLCLIIIIKYDNKNYTFLNCWQGLWNFMTWKWVGAEVSFIKCGKTVTARSCFSSRIRSDRTGPLRATACNSCTPRMRYDTFNRNVLVRFCISKRLQASSDSLDPFSVK